ncbi:hypothetical protein CMU21_14030 [Elizabethkingia anophelis]|uniref:FISUMP domain-containing protein n=1 Tax=Elizabethkingia meningoseptica TaxID=238 RepID=UPI000B3574D3|nr:FISUMP domain-containing protein [Elizabethkingia meningoseptica]MDV3748951.1 hypothetical protein [Elizabethkingia anophelis]
MKINNLIRKATSIGFGLIFLSQTILSCRNNSTNENIESGSASVKVTLSGDSFQDEGNINIGASATLKKENAVSPIKEQVQVIPLKEDNDYVLVATLTPERQSENLVNKTQATTKFNSYAVTETKPLESGIRYKVVVYDNNGKYVKEQNYVSGQAGPDIDKLDGESTYTFIVYSIGSKIDLPDVIYSDSQNKTLQTATINNISGDSDLMYFSKSMKVTGNNINYLDITLKHKYSQITTILDASPTAGYKVLNVSGASILPHSGSSNIKLSDGTTTVTSAYGSKTITFPTLGTTAVTSSPVFINSEDIPNGSFKINSVTLQYSNGLQVTHQNISFTNLKITRGVKYNLKLSFTPNDKYLNYKGYSAVRINGVIIMRHNLGANYSSDPDTASQNIMGNYYQWGRNKVVATNTTGTGAISGWDSTTQPPANSWNLGNEEIPKKNSTNDPCPSGWRVMTWREYTLLTSNTNYSYTGNAATNNPASAIGILTSKFNSSIKVTFPFTGFRDGFNGSFQINGNGSNNIEGEYWTANGNTNSDSSVSPVFRIFSTSGTSGFVANSGVAPRGMPIRCVAEYPY